MKMIVCVKQIHDLNQIKIIRETREPLIEGVPKKLDDLSKNALETAIRLKEQVGGEIIAISIGTSDLQSTIKEALAMGADKAIIVADDKIQISEPATTAKMLCEIIKKLEPYDIILCGEASSDEFSGQIGPRIAEILDLPQATYVKEIKEVKEQEIICLRDLEDYYEIVAIPIPCVITVTNEINEPRLPSLREILKASKKPIKRYTIGDLGIGAIADNAYQIIENLAPEIDRKRIILEGEPEDVVDKLITYLKMDGIWRW